MPYNTLMAEKEPKPLTPQDVLLNAFTYFQTERLGLDSLLNIGAAGGSPSPEVTQGVLSTLVEEGLLEWNVDKEGKVWFNIPETPPDKIQ